MSRKPVNEIEQESDSLKRRKVLSKLIASSAIVGASGFPQNWLRPVVETVLLPVHAQTSVPDSDPPAGPSGLECVSEVGNLVFEEDIALIIMNTDLNDGTSNPPFSLSAGMTIGDILSGSAIRDVCTEGFGGSPGSEGVPPTPDTEFHVIQGCVEALSAYMVGSMRCNGSVEDGIGINETIPRPVLRVDKPTGSCDFCITAISSG